MTHTHTPKTHTHQQHLYTLSCVDARMLFTRRQPRWHVEALQWISDHRLVHYKSDYFIVDAVMTTLCVCVCGCVITATCMCARVCTVRWWNGVTTHCNCNSYRFFSSYTIIMFSFMQRTIAFWDCACIAAARFPIIFQLYLTLTDHCGLVLRWALATYD